MNRMEVEARSDECIEYLGDTGVAMKNAASLGKLAPSLACSHVGSIKWAHGTAGPEKDGFHFDRVFDTNTRQDEIFDWGVKGIVEGELLTLHTWRMRS